MDGHNFDDIVSTLNRAKAFKGKPVCILMKTVMGKGVDFMEGTHHWHGKAPNDEQTKVALAQLPETLGDY
jgi:transketolase